MHFQSWRCATCRADFRTSSVVRPLQGVGRRVELYAERKRREAIEAAEAAGESFWSPILDDRVRSKLIYAVVDIAGGGQTAVMDLAQGRALRSLGVKALVQTGYSSADDLRRAIDVADEEIVITIIEALYAAFEDAADSLLQWGYRSDRHGALLFETRVNYILRSHRVSFELVNGKMTEMESQELHTSVVAPTLRLLSERPGWSEVEDAYQKALQEIADGNPDDAITDIGTAIQEALRKLACEGRDLSRLSQDAVRRRVLKGYDIKLADWIGADRSQSGDGHITSGATTEDAWLAVHVGGALILRLATGELRGS